MSSADPLADINDLPVRTQVAVIASVLRTTRDSQARMERKLDRINQGIWGLIASIIAGVAVFWITAHLHHAPAPSSTSPSIVHTRAK